MTPHKEQAGLPHGRRYRRRAQLALNLSCARAGMRSQRQRRQLDQGAQPAVTVVLECDIAAMLACDRSSDAKAKPNARLGGIARRLAPVKWRGNPLPVLG